jgi:dTDP-4-amino-4,6-dideoxygalactose transaminase
VEVAYIDALRGLSGDVCPHRSVIAPNRLETGSWDYLAALFESVKADPLEGLRGQLRKMTGRRHIFFAPSGRSAIAQVLSLLPGKEVVLPALTCPVVKSAVELADKSASYVDIDRNVLNATSLNFAPAMKPGRILIPTHLFGIATDIDRIQELANNTGCITVEDAAASFPAYLHGRMLGTYGDIGIISFENSKRIPSFRGAAIIVNNENVIDVRKLAEHRLVATTQGLPIRELLSSTIYNAGTTPWIYGRITLPRKLRFYMRQSWAEPRAKRNDATPDQFYSREFHPYQAALVSRVLRRGDVIRRHMAKLAAIYQDTFRNTTIETFVSSSCDTSGLLKFPIAFPHGERREILRLALRKGLVLDTNCERPLPAASELVSFPNARWAAENLLLLPMYRELSDKAAVQIASEVIEVQQLISKQVPLTRQSDTTQTDRIEAYR